MTFDEAYSTVVDYAAEGVDIDSVYINMGLNPDYLDDASKLSVALVIINSGCTQGEVPTEAVHAVKKAARNMIEHGQAETVSPEAAAESMDRMRHCI